MSTPPLSSAAAQDDEFICGVCLQPMGARQYAPPSAAAPPAIDMTDVNDEALDALTSNSTARLPCGHALHAECWDKCLQNGATMCPYCMQELDGLPQQQAQQQGEQRFAWTTACRPSVTGTFMCTTGFGIMALTAMYDPADTGLHFLGVSLMFMALAVSEIPAAVDTAAVRAYRRFCQCTRRRQ